MVRDQVLYLDTAGKISLFYIFTILDSGKVEW
jgi:hypothetical protein